MAAVPGRVSVLLGDTCGPLTLLPTGASSSRTYAAPLGDRRVVVKISPDPAVLRPSRRNLEVLAGLGLRVPQVLAYDEGDPTLLVMTEVPGRDLRYELPHMTPKQMTTLAGQIVDMQRRVATLPRNTGCGYVGIGEPATRTWSELVRNANARPLLDPLPPGVAALRERLEAALQTFEPHFATVEPVCFLDDITTKNVMMLDGRLTGVVDFDVVCWGDPLFHLGLTAAGVTADTPAHCRFYVEELLRHSGCDDDARRVVDLYEACCLTDFISRGHEEPRQRARLLSAAVERLARIDGGGTHARPENHRIAGARSAPAEQGDHWHR